ncbi:MAG: hypothetical protein ACREMR_00165, partial [Gemmatimonadales bacterium]
MNLPAPHAPPAPPAPLAIEGVRLAEGAAALARVARTHEPDPDRAALYAELHADFEALRIAR